MGILPLNEAEIRFRELFDLPPFEGQIQDQAIACKDRDGAVSYVFVSREFYERIGGEQGAMKSVFVNGCFAYLRKRKAWYLPGGEWPHKEEILEEMEVVRSFVGRLENSLHLAWPGAIAFGEIFACIRGESRIIRHRTVSPPVNSTNRQYEFDAKDVYAVQLYLNQENKISGHIQLAIQTFLESFHVKNIQLRFLQLLLALDVCFNRSSMESEHTISHYASILLANNKSDFLILYDEIMSFYRIRNEIMRGDNPENTGAIETHFKALAGRLEELTRDILKKMVKMNPRKRDNLFESLKYKKLSA